MVGLDRGERLDGAAFFELDYREDPEEWTESRSNEIAGFERPRRGGEAIELSDPRTVGWAVGHLTRRRRP